MKPIMRVEDRFVTTDGQLVVSGTNHELDTLTAQEISAIVGDRVCVRQPNGRELQAVVTGVDTPASLLGKRNINIRLASHDVELGAIILSLAED